VKKLLSRLMPLDRMLALAMKFGLLAKPLELAAKGWKGAQGVRTQASLALAGLVAVAASLGYLEWSKAEPLIQVLVGAAGATVLEKVNNVLPMVKQASEKVAEEAAKIKPEEPKP